MRTVMAVLAVLAVGCGPVEGSSIDTSAQAIAPTTTPPRPECPATWAAARALCSPISPCTNDGAQCWYPGMGDQLSDGTFAPGLLGCFPNANGQLEWRCAQ